MTNSAIAHGARVRRVVQGSEAAMSMRAASWCRSALRHGLDPAGVGPAPVAPTSTLRHRLDRAAELVRAAQPVLDRLASAVAGLGGIALLADADGVILAAHDNDTARASRYHALGLIAGSDWSEAAQGTNGIGTCLAEARALAILGDDHFASRNITLATLAAPLHDPSGRLAGVLAVSLGARECDSALATLIATLVNDTARTLEADWFCHHHASARIVLAEAEPGTRNPALFAVDRDDLVIGASRAARARFRLGTGSAIIPRPLGDLIGRPAPVRFEDSDRATLRQALARAGGNVSGAARLLGISRATVYRRMERAGVPVREGACVG